MNPNPVATSGQGETPRTDEKEFIINDWYDDSPNATPVVPADFARQLERELTASAARERALRDAVVAIDDYWESGNFTRRADLWKQLKEARALNPPTQ